MNASDPNFDAAAFLNEIRESDELDPETLPADWRFAFAGKTDTLQSSVETIFSALAHSADSDQDEIGGEMHGDEDDDEATFFAILTGTMREEQLAKIHSDMKNIAQDTGLEYSGVTVQPAGGDAEGRPSHQDAIEFVEQVMQDSSTWSLGDLDARADAIRSIHLQALSDAGLEAADWMPTASARFASPDLRPHEEICRRLMAAMVTTAWIYAPEELVSGRHIQEYIRDNEIKKRHFSARELEWMQSKRDDAKQHAGQAGWVTENIWSLAWLLGGAPIPTFHNEPVDADILTGIRSDVLGNLEIGIDELLAETSVQPIETIITLEDLLYCAHNALRSIAMEHPEEIPAMGYVQERRQSLTWALSPDTAWDETDVST